MDVQWNDLDEIRHGIEIVREVGRWCMDHEDSPIDVADLEAIESNKSELIAFYRKLLNEHFVPRSENPDSLQNVTTFGTPLENLYDFDFTSRRDSPTLLLHPEPIFSGSEDSYTHECVEIANTLCKMGQVFDDLCNPVAAISNYVAAIHVYERLQDDAAVTKTVEKIGLAYENMGSFERAESVFREVLQRYHTMGQPGDVSMVLCHIARCYTARRNFQEAVHYFELSIKAKNDQGGTDLESAHCLQEMGHCYGSMGMLDNGRVLCNTALRIYVDEYGFLHPAVSNTLNGIANIYLLSESYDLAEHNFLAALGVTLLLQHESSDDETLAEILHNIGILYRLQGRLASSILVLMKALRIYEKLHGADHVKMADSIINLGVAVREDGRLDEAIGKFKQAAALYGDAYGDDYIGRAVALNNLGVTYARQNNYEDATQAFKNSYVIHQKVLGPQHEHTGDMLYQVAVSQYLSGQISVAAKTASDVKRIWEESAPKKLESAWGKWLVNICCESQMQS